MLPISKFASSIQPSATLAAGAKARKLRSEGKTIYDFALGEPDFNTPAHIIAAADEAMRTGQTHYTPAGGLAEVKTAVAKWYGKTYGLEVKADNVRRREQHAGKKVKGAQLSLAQARANKAPIRSDQ